MITKTAHTYWYDRSRGFSNEYTVAIATDRTWAGVYRDAGWERIRSSNAHKLSNYCGDAATKAYVRRERNGQQVDTL